MRISGSDATPGSNVFEHTSSPTRFYKSRIAWNPADAAWNLTLKDGTVYVHGDVAPLQAIRDLRRGPADDPSACLKIP